jgi:DNA-binding PadR family transcriptional regulator
MKTHDHDTHWSARQEARMNEESRGKDRRDPRGSDRRDPRGSRARGPRSLDRDVAHGLAGYGPGYGPGFGPRGFGRRGGGRRGGRGGRGDVRAAVLLLLETEPMHGYELIQQIQDKSAGVWVPSPGSIYPALQQLEDEGLVAFERVEGRKTASLTATGRGYVEEHRADLGVPWDDVSGGVSGEARQLHHLIGALMGAVHTVGHVGTREQVREAGEVLDQARKSLYRILAEDAPTE